MRSPVASTAKTNRVRLGLLASFVVFLVGQGAWSFASASEPYPSIRLPGFGTTPTAAGLFNTSQTLVFIDFADGSTEQVEVEELMDPFRFSIARPAFQKVVQKGEAPLIGVSEVVRDFFRENAREFNADSIATQLRVCWRSGKVDVATADIVDLEPCVWGTVEL